MDQSISSGDGSSQRFELVKRYGTEDARRITRPVPGTVRVAIDGMEVTTGWTLLDRGVVAFADPPETGSSITAGFLFDVPVRFEHDQLEVNRSTFMAGDAPSIPLIEIRER